MSDDDLRQRFQRLRHDDQRGTPSFRQTLERADERRRLALGWRWAPVLATAGAAAAIALLVSRDAPEPAPAPFAPGQWVMPTDVLLELPGSTLLREVPSLGTPPLPLAPPAPRQSGLLRRTLA